MDEGIIGAMKQCEKLGPKGLFTLTHAGYRKCRLGSLNDRRILCGHCKLNSLCRTQYSAHCNVYGKFSDICTSYKYFLRTVTFILKRLFTTKKVRIKLCLSYIIL